MIVPKQSGSCKRQLTLPFAIGEDGKTAKPSLAQSKRQRLIETGAQNKEKYVCLQCLELHLKGKLDEKFTSICRVDKTSTQRHKDRLHKTPEREACTFVPGSSPEVSKLKIQYLAEIPKGCLQKEQKSRAENVKEAANVKDPESTFFSTNHDSGSSESESVLEGTDNLINHDGINENDSSSNGKACLPSRSQATLLSFTLNETPTEEPPLKQVLDAISGLSIKVDSIDKRQKTLEHLAFEEEDSVRTSIDSMKKATNIVELCEATDLIQWFHDEKTESAILRCLPCFELHIAAKQTLAKLTPFKAAQLLNSKSNGNLATGILLDKEASRSLINGHNKCWYRQKFHCIDHLCYVGDGSKHHRKAIGEYKTKREIIKKKSTVCSNLFRAAITDLKLGAAGKHFETLISFLASCSVDVGSIGHGRNNFNDMLYCLEKVLDEKIEEWLSTPLPSTLLPPHFWATTDKATPSRTTNQAVLIIARDKSGVPCPIPVSAPPVYDAFEQASYDVLAQQLLDGISNHFSDEVLSRLCGVSADGPSQAAGFREHLVETLKLEEDSDLALPITWDPAHLLNLAVTDVRDSQTPSGIFLRQFIKRCNVFNQVLAHGKGFAFLEMVDEHALRPVSYATQRFASSSYNQWLKIEKSYGSFWKAFHLLHPNRNENEEWQYMIGGSDFVTDLLALLDILGNVVELMLRVQALDTPVWKLKLWWPKVQEKLIKAANGDQDFYPRLKGQSNLGPGDVFKGVTLLEGWLVMQDNGKQSGEGRFNWQLRDARDIEEDRKRFANDLMTALEKRISSVTGHDAISTLQVFDAASLVTLFCGTAVENKITFFLPEGELEEYGVDECRRLMKEASKRTHAKASGINFDHRLAHSYMGLLKKAIMEGVWNGICPERFEVADDKGTKLFVDGISLVEFRALKSTELDCFFLMRFSDGKAHKVKLCEKKVFESFYSKKDLYDIAKPPSCTLLDIVLAKGGPEAIAESFYSAMRFQQQAGGQSNETLVRRTKVTWCLPSLQHCEELIKKAVAIYLQSDDNLRPHHIGAFFSSRSKQYTVSKVVDRIHAELGHCPFLASA